MHVLRRNLGTSQPHNRFKKVKKRRKRKSIIPKFSLWSWEQGARLWRHVTCLICTSLIALFTAFSYSVLLNFLAEDRRRPLVWQYRRTLLLEIPRICGNFACKCCWTSLKKPPESRIFLISSFTPNEAITLMFLHVIPPNNKPATIQWEQIPCDMCAAKKPGDK